MQMEALGREGKEWGRKGRKEFSNLREPITQPPPPPISGCRKVNLQSKCLVPLRVERALDGFGLLLALAFRVRNKFQFYVGI